jgi:hypothetical protein
MHRIAYQKLRTAILAIAFLMLGDAAPIKAQTAITRIDEALQNITTLVRVDRVGYATFWDGNKYIQCRRMKERELRCEAAGASMQPTLNRVLTGERLNRLAALGWILDPAFGNYVKIFAAQQPTAPIADQIQQTLIDVYDADMTALELSTRWVADTPCPPRAGYSQNLAGSVNDQLSTRFAVIRSCSYAPPEKAQAVSSLADLIAIYGATATSEIQRLRINATQRVWVIFDAGIGYVQCSPDQATTVIYCEAQSAESWPALTAILTPQRVALLRKMEYADPGRAPNYSKNYPQTKYTDAAIAHEILTILHEVYGYTGSSKLKFKTEQPN